MVIDRIWQSISVLFFSSIELCCIVFIGCVYACSVGQSHWNCECQRPAMAVHLLQPILRQCCGCYCCCYCCCHLFFCSIQTTKSIVWSTWTQMVQSFVSFSFSSSVLVYCLTCTHRPTHIHRIMHRLHQIFVRTAIGIGRCSRYSIRKEKNEMVWHT